jgi:tetratricopeptide (TPR) repeat protein
MFSRNRGGQEVSMQHRQHSDKSARWPLPIFFVLLVLGTGNSGAQEVSGTALVLKGISQYEDSASFRSAIKTLEQAMTYKLDYRDSTRALFYLGFCNYKLGYKAVGDRYLRMIVRRNPGARLPRGAEEFAETLAGIKKRVKESPDEALEEPPPADTAAEANPPLVPESVYVRYPVHTQPALGQYLSGAAAGAVLGLASYSVSVLFDNLAAAKVKAYNLTSDSDSAEELRTSAGQYHSLGSAFYYSSYPLVAIGFYAGFRLSQRMFGSKVSFLRDDSPTQVCCSVNRDRGLSLEIRRSIW